MMKARSLAVLLSFLIAACSIHPRPEDYFNVSTYEIVARIRCESKEAVRSSMMAYLQSRQDEGTKAALRAHLGGGGQIETVHPRMFAGEVRSMLSMFWRTGIAYNFTLDMSEVNNVGSETNLLKPLTSIGWNVGLKSSLDRSRQNVRTFTITTTFESLLRIPQDACQDRIVSENFIYPITGKIGVEGMIHAFVYLTLFQELAGKADAPKGPPTLVDALSFTTAISGSASPKVSFAPASALHVANSGLTSTVSCTDVHKVVVGLALDPIASGMVESVRETYGTQLISANPKTAAERAAANAVDQFLEQRIFSPTIVLPQP